MPQKIVKEIILANNTERKIFLDNARQNNKLINNNSIIIVKSIFGN